VGQELNGERVNFQALPTPTASFMRFKMMPGSSLWSRLVSEGTFTDTD